MAYQAPSIHLNILREISYLSSAKCDFLMEAAAICFENQGHTSGVKLIIEGDIEAEICLEWDAITQVERDSHFDLIDATEDGACGIALLLIEYLSPYQTIRQSRKSTGFDYWLADQDDQQPFQNAARLEISGILKGNRKLVEYRTLQKAKQTQQSDDTRLPAYIIIVEFSEPYIYILKR